jgi:membrane-associated phospholipid phosphatase
MNIKNIIFLLIFGIILHSSQCQLPYKLDLRMDIPLSVAGVGLLGAAIIIGKNNKGFTPEELEELVIPKINKLDQSSLKRWSPKAQKASDFLMFFSLATPASLFAGKKVRENWNSVSVIGLQTYLIGGGITSLTKESVMRTRPFVYNDQVPMSYKIKKDARRSFFSGHTSFSAFGTFMTAKMFSDHYPNSKWRGAVWTSSSLLPAVTGFLRYWGGKHYPSDILVGYLVGAAVGILLPQIHIWAQ